MGRNTLAPKLTVIPLSAEATTASVVFFLTNEKVNYQVM